MTEPTSPKNRISRASAMIASGTLVSRALGFVSATVLVWTIGTQNPAANAFALANTLPSNLYALIAGGLTSAVLVPQIVRSAGHNDGGQTFVNRLLTLGISVFAVFGVLATLGAPLIVSLYTQAGDDRALDDAGFTLAVGFAYWCLPQLFFYAVYSLLGEVLNAREVFGAFTWAPALNNLVMIGTLLIFSQTYGTDPAHRDPASWSVDQVALLAGGATLGIAAQALVLTIFWRRTGLRFRPDFRWRGAGLSATGRAAGWTLGMVIITQLTILVQVNVASLAGSKDPSLAVLGLAWLVFMLPHSIIALSVATPFFTRMSAHASAGNLASFREDLSTSLRTILLLITGAGAAITIAALPFGAFFTSGAPQEIFGFAGVLLAYLLGLVPFSTVFVLQRAFFALADVRTPFFIQLVQGTVAAGVLLSVAFLVPPAQIGVGVALATTIASTVQALVLAAVLRRRIGGISGRLVLTKLAVFLTAAATAAIFGVATLFLLGGFTEGFALSSRFAAFVSLVILGVVTLAVYFGSLLLARIPEAHRGVSLLLRR